MDNVNFENIRRKIMIRIYAIWFFRKLTSPFVFEVVFLGIILILMMIYVSFYHVAKNVSPLLSSFSLIAIVIFFVSAFLATGLIVKVLSLALLLFSGLLGKDFFNFLKKKNNLSPLSPL